MNTSSSMIAGRFALQQQFSAWCRYNDFFKCEDSCFPNQYHVDRLVKKEQAEVQKAYGPSSIVRVSSHFMGSASITRPYLAKLEIFEDPQQGQALSFSSPLTHQVSRTELFRSVEFCVESYAGGAGVIYGTSGDGPLVHTSVESSVTEPNCVRLIILTPQAFEQAVSSAVKFADGRLKAKDLGAVFTSFSQAPVLVTTALKEIERRLNHGNSELIWPDSYDGFGLRLLGLQSVTLSANKPEAEFNVLTFRVRNDIRKKVDELPYSSKKGRFSEGDLYTTSAKIRWEQDKFGVVSVQSSRLANPQACPMRFPLFYY